MIQSITNNQIIAGIFTLPCPGFHPIWRRILPDQPEFPNPGEKYRLAPHD